MFVSSVFLLLIFEKEIRISNSSHLELHFKEYLLNVPKQFISILIVEFIYYMPLDFLIAVNIVVENICVKVNKKRLNL